MVYVGVDPGLKGGIALLGERGGIKKLWRMPIRDGEYSAEGLLGILDEIQGEGPARATIERMLGPPKGIKAIEARGFARMFRFVFLARGIQAVEVPARTWQAAMLAGAPGADTKARARVAAGARWPGETFTPERCLKPQDGLIDAAWVAEYGRTHPHIFA